MLFETEMYITTFIYIVLISLFIPKIVRNIIHNKNDKTFHIEFLFLTLSVLINNISSGFLPDKNIKINPQAQNVIAYTCGATTILYFFYFVSKYYSISYKRYLNINYIVIFISLSLTLLFITPYIITNNLKYSRDVFLISPLILIMILIAMIYRELFERFIEASSKEEKIHQIAGMSGLLSIISVPLTMIILGDNQVIEQSLWSIGYFVILYEYIRYKRRLLNPYNLTDREREILDFFIKNAQKKFFELSDLLNISEKTFSVHMSNIYKKMNVSNKIELLEKVNTHNHNY